MFKHILLPTDGSQLSEAAMEKGIRFAKTINARVTGLCVMPLQHVGCYETEIRIKAVEARRQAYKELAETSWRRSKKRPGKRA